MRTQQLQLNGRPISARYMAPKLLNVGRWASIAVPRIHRKMKEFATICESNDLQGNEEPHTILSALAFGFGVGSFFVCIRSFVFAVSTVVFSHYAPPTFPKVGPTFSRGIKLLCVSETPSFLHSEEW